MHKLLAFHKYHAKLFRTEISFSIQQPAGKDKISKY